MSLLEGIKLEHISDADLRGAIESMVSRGALDERQIVAVAVALEIQNGGTNGGESGKQVAASAPANRRSKSRGKSQGKGKGKAKGPRAKAGAINPSRALQGQYLAAIRRVPKSRRGKYSAIAKDEAQGREAAIRAINKDYPA